jgi:two-component system, chemotaxis family, CheB/CheR fusion protein
VVQAEGAQHGFDEILEIVRTQTGSDFRCYKKGTIVRRINRRMGLHHIQDLPQYNRLLRQNDDEIVQLHRDLLINVTAFFRDAEAFETLRRDAIAPLVRTKQIDDPVRVWVPGCSSGEEAYSIAMQLRETLETAQKHWDLQVFATDIDEEALQVGRTGIYPESIVADVGTDRLARFFARKDGGYQVIVSLRMAAPYSPA